MGLGVVQTRLKQWQLILLQGPIGGLKARSRQYLQPKILGSSRGNKGSTKWLILGLFKGSFKAVLRSDF